MHSSKKECTLIVLSEYNPKFITLYYFQAKTHLFRTVYLWSTLCYNDCMIMFYQGIDFNGKTNQYQTFPIEQARCLLHVICVKVQVKARDSHYHWFLTGYSCSWWLHEHSVPCMYWRNKCWRRHKKTWLWTACCIRNTWQSLW